VGKISVIFYKYSIFDVEKTPFTIVLKDDSNIFKIETGPNYTRNALHANKRKMNGFYLYIFSLTGLTG